MGIKLYPHHTNGEKEEHSDDMAPCSLAKDCLGIPSGEKPAAAMIMLHSDAHYTNEEKGGRSDVMTSHSCAEDCLGIPGTAFGRIRLGKYI